MCDAQGDEADLSHLDESETAAVHALLTSTDFSALVEPWQPWWLLPEARTLKLTATGNRLVTLTTPLPLGQAAPHTTQQHDIIASNHVPDFIPAPFHEASFTRGSSDIHRRASTAEPVHIAAPETPLDDARSAKADDNQAVSENAVKPEDDSLSDEDDGASRMPEPSITPLPPLSSLTSAPPSPLLHFQLLQLVYAYCLCMRLYNGDPSCDWASYAQCLWSIVPSLFKAPSEAPLPESGPQALVAAVESACEPPVGDSSSRVAAHSIIRDVRTLLGCSRPAVLCMLVDVQRQLSHAMPQALAKRMVATPRLPRKSSSQNTHTTVMQRKSNDMSTSVSDCVASLPTVQGQERRVVSRTAVSLVQGQSGDRIKLQVAKERRSFMHGCQSAVRKLVFLQSWVNELGSEDFVRMKAIVEEQVLDLSDVMPTAQAGVRQ